MRGTMSNFCPMLSSSPPPIDEVDNLDNDDDDDGFGTFATANAFDCSFDSPTFSKGVKSNGESCLLKKIENESFGTIENRNSSSDIDARTRIQKLIPDVTKTSGVCENGVSVLNEAALGDVSSEARDINQDCQKNCSSDSFDDEELGLHLSVAKNSSLTNVCNNGHDICLVNASPLSSGEIDKFKIIGDSVDNDVSNEDFDDKTLCDKKCINNLPVEDLIPEISLISDDVSMGLTSAEDVAPTAELSDIKEKSTLDDSNSNSPNQSVLHLNASSSGEVPDLTFVPFTDLEASGESDNFAEFQDSNFCDDIKPGMQSKPHIEIDDTEIQNESDSDFDEFGNFESGEPAESNTNAQSIDMPVEEFADFSKNVFDNSESSMPSDDFADFESAGLETTLKTSISVPQEHVKSTDKITTIIHAVFPLSEEPHLDDSSEKHCELLDKNCKGHRLWERLHETDHLPGSPFQWSVSHTFQQLLRSINVDYHSILRTSTVPFFASGLGLLEPTKSTTVQNESRKSSIDLQISEDTIPPVHFDWSSSGLVNPLDCSQAISTLMDVTFLNNSGNSTPQCDTSRDFSFEVELLSHQVTSPPESSQKPLVEHILSLGAKSSQVDTQSGSRPSGLSQETIHVLDQLPNLSYMRAQMLMFPVSNDSSCS